MKRGLVVLSVVVVMCPAYANAAKPVAGVCKTLSDQYDGLSKQLAMANELADDNPQRMTILATEENTYYVKALLLQNTMTAAKCTLPTDLPDATRYYHAALMCKAALKRDKVTASGLGLDKYPDLRSVPATEEACDAVKWQADPSK